MSKQPLQIFHPQQQPLPQQTLPKVDLQPIKAEAQQSPKPDKNAQVPLYDLKCFSAGTKKAQND